MKKNKLFKSSIAGAVLASGLAFSAPQTLADQNFTDLASNGSHNESVKYLNNLDAFDYKTGSKLNGNQPITRAEVSKILHTLFEDEMEEVREYNNNFKDVNDNTPHDDEIEWSYEVGIIDGSNGKFNPNQTLTRAQMAKILVTAFKLKEKANGGFNSNTKHWANEYISVLASHGYTTATNTVGFKPEDKLTLNQFSTFLYRIAKDDETPSTNTTIKTDIDDDRDDVDTDDDDK